MGLISSVRVSVYVCVCVCVYVATRGENVNVIVQFVSCVYRGHIITLIVEIQQSQV